MSSKRSVGVVLFEGFELLDVFGPLEMYGMFADEFDMCIVAEKAGDVASGQGPRTVVEHRFSDGHQYDMLLVPGGSGTRREVNNHVILDWLRGQADNAEHVTSVCTGSALLAKTGLLDGVRATTNKMAFQWATSQGPNVLWEKQARWVEDGKFFTSSGVSAGMDMSLALMEQLLGSEAAEQATTRAEYARHTDARWDPFAKVHGLV